MNRRDFLTSAAAMLASTALPSPGRANVPTAYTWNVAPPMDSRDNFIAWMVKNRGENPKYLGLRDGILDASPAPDGLQAQLYLRFRRIEHGNARTESGATSPGR